MESDQPSPVDQTAIDSISHLALRFQERAEETDQAGPANPLLRENIRVLADSGYFGAGIPAAYGGLGLSGDARVECSLIIAAACGVTSFTQTQLHSGGGFVGGAHDESVKQELLPQFAAGKILCGVAFSHLRRPGPPAVKAIRGDGGYVITGEAPWVTGWSMLDSFILGTTAEDSSLLYFYVPIPAAGSSLEASPPMRLAAMDSSDTVRVSVRDLFVEGRYLLYSLEPDSLRRRDFCGITGHSWQPLGCARGSVALLRSLAAASSRPALVELADNLAAEIDQWRHEAVYWNASRADEPEYRDRALAARAGAIDIALRAASAAIAATGGRAHLLTNPAQRRLREAGFYSTLALTPDVQTALLECYAHGCPARS